MKRAWWGLAAMVVLTLAGMIALSGSRAQAQFSAPKFLKATARAPKTVVPGKPFTVTVSITVDKPYHIQANPPKADYIATVVDFSGAKGFKVGKITYPHAKQAQIGSETLPVYEGTVQVKAALTAEKGVKPGRVTLPITVKFQGCNDKTCYPPSKIATQTAVTVRAATAQKKKS